VLRRKLELGRRLLPLAAAVLVVASWPSLAGASYGRTGRALIAEDPNRNHTQTTDADGRKVAYEYDELNRLFRTRRDPTGLNLTTTTTQFDANGNPERVVEANGEVTIQTWDELNRLKTRRYEPAAGWTPLWAYTTEERYFYNPNSSLERIEEVDRDQAGAERLVRVTTRDYDNLERQTGETFTQQDGSTRAVSTEYWPNGAVKSVTDPAGTTSFTYDGQNREETATTPAGVTTKTYFPDGLVKDVTFPNGTKRAYLYDKADRALSIVTTKGGTLVSSVAYTYDDNGNRLTQVQVNGGAAETTSYTYDALNRLETTTYPADAGHVNGRAVTYGYDHAGNRKTETVTDPVTLAVLESRTGIFDQANRLTQLTDNLDAAQTATLTWDANGNLLSETKAGVTTTYRYDLRNTLGEVQRGAQVLARFLGDFDERRVLKIGDPTRPGGAGTQEYLYHRSRLVSEIEATQPTARYEWTNEELISLFRSDGTRRYYALDGLETVMALTDEQGAATDRLALDVWGVPRAGTDFGTSGNRYAFTSHRYDTETGLYYAGARMYSPAVGRFISQDDVAPTLNRPETWHLFTYGANRPTYYTDPTGHSVWTKAWKVVKTGGRISAIWEGVASDIDAMGRTNRFMDHLGLGLSIATELLPVSAHDVFDTYTAVQDGNYENLARRAASRTGVGRVALGTERGLQATQELAEGNYAEAGKHFAQAAATMGSGRVPRGRRSSSERKGKSGEAETVVEPRSTVGGTKTDPIARPADAPEALPSRPESSPHYSNWFEAQLKEDTFKSSDANHFRQANRQLYERLQNDPDFAKAMERQYPGITAHVTPGPRDGVSDAPPSGLTWHHEAHRPGTLQLVPRPHHQAPGPVQGTLHPDGKGGRENWGGGRRPRPKADEEPE
jgi:RHS repeat-associated protein